MDEFNAVDKHLLDFASLPPFYWQDKWPEAGMFGYTIGGLSAMETLFWYEDGGGLELMRKMIEGYNVVPIPAFLQPPELYMGSNRELKSLADLKGLKMRTAGDDASILSAMGVSVTGISVGEVYESMQRGVLDAYQIGSPSADLGFAMQEVTDYMYLSPSRQPTTTWCDGVNTDAWEELPDDLKLLFMEMRRAEGIRFYGETLAMDISAVVELKDYGVVLAPIPQDIEDETYRLADEFYAEKSAASPSFAEIYNSIQDFQTAYREAWQRL